jgi:hypothetical protein
MWNPENMRSKAIVMILLMLACAAAEARNLRAEAQCPPPGLDSVKDFDLQAYIAAPWYGTRFHTY